MELPEFEISPTEQFNAIKQAAESGNIKAMVQLSEFYEKGFGTTANPEKADYWRKEAGLFADKK